MTKTSSPSTNNNGASFWKSAVASIHCSTKWRLLPGALFVIVVIVAAVWTHHAVSQQQEDNFEIAVSHTTRLCMTTIRHPSN